MTTLQLKFSDNTAVTLETVQRPTLAFVRFCHDYTADFKEFWVYNPDGSIFRKGVSVPTRNEIRRGDRVSVRHVHGLPDPCQMVETGYTTNLSQRGYPEYIKNVWRFMYPGIPEDLIERAFVSTYQTDRAFNNGAQGEDGQAAITCAGAVHKITGPAVIMGGRAVYPIETIRGDGPAPDVTKINPKTTPWLFFPATSSRRERDPLLDPGRDIARDGYLGGLRWEKEDVQEQFWQLGGRTVWLPLLSRSGRNFLDGYRLRILGPTEPIPSPYHR